MGYYEKDYRRDKIIKKGPLLDSSIYENVCLLSKIALDEKLTDDEWAEILERFKRTNTDE